MRISDWSSDVCSSDLADAFGQNFDYTSVANGPSAVSTTFSGYAGVILSFNASQTAAADSALNYQTFFFEDLQARFQSEAGVNLDEELANMTIFQKDRKSTRLNSSH